MYRLITDELKKWKNQKDHPLLILKGGMKVGKTWVLCEFGKQFFQDVLYVDCSKTAYMSYLAGKNMEPERIFRMLDLYHGRKIKAGETLLIFDEIQTIPGLLQALIRLADQCPEHTISCTGMFLERELPCVGEETETKPEILNVMPLNFREFLLAGKKELQVKELQGGALLEPDRRELLECLCTYLMVGGMPEAVHVWLKSRNMEKVREVQRELLEVNMERIEKHFQAIPIGAVRDALEQTASMLSVEYKEWSGAEAEALSVLLQSGLLYKVNRITQGKWPPESYIDEESYQIYVLDVGLLSVLYDLPEITAERMHQIRNGAMIQQLVWQELYANKNVSRLYYWRQEREVKVDFVFNDERLVIPVSICMNEEDRQNGLTVFKKLYAPPASIKISRMQTTQEQDVLTIPIYGIWNL